MIDVKEFLKKYQMSSSDIDINSTLLKFNEEINKGLSKNGTIDECSIPMIATYLDPNCKLNKEEKVILVDAGGTNLRVGLAYYDKEWIISDVITNKMPGIDKEYSSDEFFDYIAKCMIPYLDKAKNIGFCFSYRVAMSSDLDGTLIAWAKEIKAPDVVGKKVGYSLLQAIKKYSNVERKIVVLNDTASVLLGGISLNPECDKYIGMIYGTGFNCCYEEAITNITKLHLNKPGNMIINTETGNFNGFIHGVFDQKLTEKSLIKNEALTEKMSSGRYLATLIYLATTTAIKEGLIKETKIQELEDSFDLPLVSKYLSGLDNTLDNYFNGEDKLIFIDICKELINRASKVVAITTSAFAIKSNVKKVGIIVEGSTFYKLPYFKDSFTNYLKEILDTKQIEFVLIDGRDRILYGALMASMMNK